MACLVQRLVRSVGDSGSDIRFITNGRRSNQPVEPVIHTLRIKTSWGSPSYNARTVGLHVLLWSEKTLFFKKKNFGGHKSILWGHWFPYFGHLKTPPMGFKEIVFLYSSNISSVLQRNSRQPYSHLSEAFLLNIPWHSPLVWHLMTTW